ncbi:MAG: 3-oxoacyl-[acyl-carrier-protein] reductase [Rectinemataceae bacterium]
MEKLLAGKTCVITGGSRGIGLAIVRAFASEGGKVFYLSRSETADPAALAALAAEGGGSATWISCDVGSEASVEAALAAVITQGGTPEVLVNNAGITRDGLIFRMKLEDWEAVMATNLTSAFLVCRSAARHMIKARRGSIINITSVVGITGNGGQANYSASKAGLIGFTKSLARELASRNVRVNALAPGFIDTAMTDKLGADAKQGLVGTIPLGRTGSPQDVAKAALFLASDLASYVTGEVLKVDGGMAM